MTVSQKKQFLIQEGDSWFSRNFEKQRKQNISDDLALGSVIHMLHGIDAVLEVGCSDGWRLNELFTANPDIRYFGIDPSQAAIEAGTKRYSRLNLSVGTADALPHDDRSIDILIAGFCLYLCDREDLFKIACECDRVLRPGGKIVITDFLPPFPYKNQYHHSADLFSYKMDYAKMFLWNPQYQLIERKIVDYTSGHAEIDKPDDQIGLSVLLKSTEQVYPLSPSFTGKRN